MTDNLRPLTQEQRQAAVRANPCTYTAEVFPISEQCLILSKISPEPYTHVALQHLREFLMKSAGSSLSTILTCFQNGDIIGNS